MTLSPHQELQNENYKNLVNLAKTIQNSEHTKFHHFLGYLANPKRDLIKWYITQNIDGFERRIKALEEKTVTVHGRLDLEEGAKCFNGHSASLDLIGTKCEFCYKDLMEKGKRVARAGTLEMNVLLYDDNRAIALQIEQKSANNLEKILKEKVDLVVIVGTHLTIVGIQKFILDYQKQHPTTNFFVVNPLQTSLGTFPHLYMTAEAFAISLMAELNPNLRLSISQNKSTRIPRNRAAKDAVIKKVSPIKRGKSSNPERKENDRERYKKEKQIKAEKKKVQTTRLKAFRENYIRNK